MLMLNPEKENLLESKYGFEKETRVDGSYYYGKKAEHSRFARSSRMYVDNRRVTIASFSLLNQDLLYDMIIDGTLIKMPNTQSKQQNIEKQIQKLKEKLKELEEVKNENN